MPGAAAETTAAPSSCSLVASARLALRIVGRSSPFPVRPPPPVALSSSRSSALPVIACAYFALCASVRGFIFLQKETRPKASKAPGCSAERKARAVPLLYLLLFAGNLHGFPSWRLLDVPGLPVLLLPSCFNACIGCGKSRAFCSGNSPGCPRFVPSLCEKSAFGFWSAAPCGFRSSSPGFLYRKLSRQGPAVAVPVRLLRVRFSMCPGGAGCTGCQATKGGGKIAVFLLGKLPGIICAAQLLREKLAFIFASVPLCIFPAGAMRNETEKKRCRK